jgi:hypothetical protein
MTPLPAKSNEMPPKSQSGLARDAADAKIAASHGVEPFLARIVFGNERSAATAANARQVRQTDDSIGAHLHSWGEHMRTASAGSGLFRNVNLDCFITRTREDPENATFRV